MEVLIAIKKQLVKSPEGPKKWDAFVQSKAIRIMRAERTPSGAHMVGSYQSSMNVDPGFFTTVANKEREKRLVEVDMPFLNNIILGIL